MNELHLFQDRGLARFTGSKKKHLDLIPEVHFIPLQLILNLLIPRLALLGLRTLIATHFGGAAKSLSQDVDDCRSLDVEIRRAARWMTTDPTNDGTTVAKEGSV